MMQRHNLSKRRRVVEEWHVCKELIVPASSRYFMSWMYFPDSVYFPAQVAGLIAQGLSNQTEVTVYASPSHVHAFFCF